MILLVSVLKWVTWLITSPYKYTWKNIQHCMYTQDMHSGSKI
jgi:hypothetical protein